MFSFPFNILPSSSIPFYIHDLGSPLMPPLVFLFHPQWCSPVDYVFKLCLSYTSTEVPFSPFCLFCVIVDLVSWVLDVVTFLSFFYLRLFSLSPQLNIEVILPHPLLSSLVGGVSSLANSEFLSQEVFKLPYIVVESLLSVVNLESL